MSRRPRVLQVLQPEDGGTAEHVLLLAEGLKKRRWDVEVASSADNMIRPALARAQIPSHVLPLVRQPGLHDLRAARALRRLDRGRGYDLVHGHSSKAGALVRLALPRPRRLVYTAHNFPFAAGFGRAQRLLYRSIEQALVPRSGAIVAVSEHQGAEAAAALRGAAPHMRVIRQGVRACEESAADGALLAFKGRGVLAGLVSVLRPQKDPLSAVRAIALLAAKGNVPGRLAIVGNGWLEADVRREIARLGASEFVRWFPFEGDVARYLRALDLFVLPSVWEPIGMAPMEAMMCGIPVLATAVGGIPEVVQDGRTGRLVPPGDPRVLAAALEELLRDRELRSRMGDEGRAVATASFHADRMINETERVYRDLLEDIPSRSE